MAIYRGDIPFTGKLSDISAYKRRGSDVLILRTKGGASKKKIATAPSFDTTRKLNTEWRAVMMAAQTIRFGLPTMQPLADHNAANTLNGLMKRIQTRDTTHVKGKRSLLFTANKEAISSFNYNKKVYFDSIVRQPLEVVIDAPTSVVSVTTASLQPSVTLFTDPQYAYYRLVQSVASVSDYQWSDKRKGFEAIQSALPAYEPLYTPWMVASVVQSPATYTLTPKRKASPIVNGVLIVGAGIQYGKPGIEGNVEPVEHAGAARIIKCV